MENHDPLDPLEIHKLEDKIVKESLDVASKSISEKML
jgi:hypothetical protein